MRLVQEYGDRKEKNGIAIGERNIIRDMYKNGVSVQRIAEMTGNSVPAINFILF